MPSRVKSRSPLLLVNYSELAYKELPWAAWANFSGLWAVFRLHVCYWKASAGTLPLYIPSGNEQKKSWKSTSYFFMRKGTFKWRHHWPVTDWQGYMVEIAHFTDHSNCDFFFFFLNQKTWQSFSLQISLFYAAQCWDKFTQNLGKKKQWLLIYKTLRATTFLKEKWTMWSKT